MSNDEKIYDQLKAYFEDPSDITALYFHFAGLVGEIHRKTQINEPLNLTFFQSQFELLKERAKKKQLRGLESQIEMILEQFL